MNRILCFFGLHKWIDGLIEKDVDGAIWLFDGKRCRLCGTVTEGRQ